MTTVLELISAKDLLQNYGQAWDSLLSFDKRGRFFSSAPWIENVFKTENCEMFFLCTFQKGNLTSGVPVNFITSEECDYYQFVTHLQNEMPLIPLDFDFKNAPSFLMYENNISLFNRAGSSFDFRYSKHLTEKEQFECFKKIFNFIDTSEQFSFPAKAILFSKKLPEQYKAFLEGQGYLELLVGARYSLPHSNFEQYVLNLSGEKRRAVLKELRKNQKHNLLYKVVPYLDFINDFLPMIQENFERHGFDHFSQDFYKRRSDEMFNHFGEKLFFLKLEHDEKAVGGMLCILQDRCLYLYHVGFLYKEIKKEWSAYFNFAFYKPLLLAATKELEFDEIYLFEGADRLKLSRGGTPEYLYHYLKLDNLNNEQRQHITGLNEQTILEQIKIGNNP